MKRSVVIRNGRLVDGRRDIVQDLWVLDGKICEPFALDGSTKVIDATGMVVMPGGVDMHSHFVGPKVNSARQMIARVNLHPFDLQTDRPQNPFVPDLYQTGMRYAGLGYTTAFDAAVPALFARQAQLELECLPLVDAGYFALVGNNKEMLEAVTNNDKERTVNFLRTTVIQSGAYAAKIVNPGGVEDWKSGYREGIGSIDQKLNQYNTTPREIIRQLAAANESLGLPHGVHIHCNRLGLPGNWQTTLDTMQAVGDSRCHLAHVQFHSYRGADDEASFGSAVDPLVDYVNSHPNLSVDIGQIMFGDTMSMTGDSALGYYLQKISGKPWVSIDTEKECGCGISPIKYRHRDRIHGLQWAIGLEWMLKAANLWQLALSTDHPNGASFLTYPAIIALLMDADLRRTQLEKLHDGVREHCDLFDIDREFSLQEIAIVTRSAPAQLLGLPQKGNLNTGSDADIVIYSNSSNVREMFEFPRLVIKGGVLIIDDGEPLSEPPTRHLMPSDHYA